MAYTLLVPYGLHIPKNIPRRTWFLSHAYFILGKLKVFVWNGVGNTGRGKLLDFDFYSYQVK